MAKRKKIDDPARDDATHDACLALRFTPQDIGEEMTVREYLKRLLLAVLDEGESFSGKRPFGNSGWEDNLVFPLVECGLLAGTIDDSDPDYLECNDWDYDEMVVARKALVERALEVA